MGSSSDTDLLREGVTLLGVPDPQRAAHALEKFLEELSRWNSRFGFVKADSPRDVIVKHVLDSLAAWQLVRDEAHGGSVLDVGSGAGFPGIPLAIALPDLSFTLLERSQKKASFLRTCRVLLPLARLSVIHGDLSAVTESFDVVTFRAVAPLARFLRDAERGGLAFHSVVAYKGRADRARAEVEEVRTASGARCEGSVVPLVVPFLDEERCAALLRVSPLLTKH